MSTYDLIIRGGILVTQDRGEVVEDLGIYAGRIASIEPHIEGTAPDELDATGLHIFPGAVDAHVHFNEQGRTEWEGLTSGSKAAAAGGTTTFFDMPLNSHPPVLDADSFDRKRALAEAASLVDFGLWGGLVPGNLDRLEELAERGVVGFKAFMSNSGIEDFPMCDDLTLYEGMARAGELGCIVAVHAENEQITSGLARRAIAGGHTGVRDFLNSRPAIAEVEAIRRAITFAEDTGCALHIVHVSTGRGVALVAEARARGVDVSCETCPHYLAFTGEDVERLGGIAKCAPPIRSREEQEALWQALLNGTLPMVASDHSPSLPSMKEGEDFFRVWGGIAGCQSLLAVLLTEGHAVRKMPTSMVARFTSHYVAERFGISHLKGRLEVGADADLALVDMESTYTLQASDLFYRHRLSPYIGRTFRGRVVRTLVRGVTVFQDGKIVSKPAGRLVRPRRKTVAK